MASSGKTRDMWEVEKGGGGGQKGLEKWTGGFPSGVPTASLDREIDQQKNWSQVARQPILSALL